MSDKTVTFYKSALDYGGQLQGWDILRAVEENAHELEADGWEVNFVGRSHNADRFWDSDDDLGIEQWFDSLIERFQDDDEYQIAKAN